MSNGGEAELVLPLLGWLIVVALCVAVYNQRWLWTLYQRVLDNRMRACAESRARTSRPTSDPDERKRLHKLEKQASKRKARERLR
jgi:hypothetical protein